MIAANRKIRKIAYRRYFDNVSGRTTPTSSKNTNSTGNRNDRPNARVTRNTNPRYRSKLNNGTIPLPAKPSMKPKALGRVKSVSYTHLRAHETPEQLVCRL